MQLFLGIGAWLNLCDEAPVADQIHAIAITEAIATLRRIEIRMRVIEAGEVCGDRPVGLAKCRRLAKPLLELFVPRVDVNAVELWVVVALLQFRMHLGQHAFRATPFQGAEGLLLGMAAELAAAEREAQAMRRKKGATRKGQAGSSTREFAESVGMT